MTNASPPVLPVLLVTGFLGSGKTTLVNRLLRDAPRTAVVVNEFGTIPVDQKLLEDAGAPLAVLSGGCLCCQVRNAMAPLLRNLWMAWRERKAFDQVLIETSGVASPGPVIDTLLTDRWLAQRFRLQAVVTTVSAADGAVQLARFPEAVAQVALADVLLVTHGDLVRTGDISRLSVRLEELAPATPRLDAHPQAVGFDRLRALRAETSGLGRMPAADLEHGFRSLTLRLDTPVRWASVEPALTDLIRRHADRLLRLKGVVQLADGGATVVIQASAGRLYAPVTVTAPASATPRGQLVLIGTGPLEALVDELVAVLAQPSAPPASRRLH